MNIIIVGGVKKARYLIKTFAKNKNKVVFINKDIKYCRLIEQEFEIKVICGDASKPNVFSSIEPEFYDILIALCPSDADNLCICRLAKELGVKRTISVVNNECNKLAFKKLGIDTPISVTGLISTIIEKNAYTSRIEELVSIDEGKAIIMEIELDNESPIVNKTLVEAKLPEDCSVSCIIRNGNAVIPRGGTVLLEKDKLVIISLPEISQKVVKAVRGAE